MNFDFSLPRAFGTPSCRGVIKSQAEDFQVQEVLGFELDGEGEHVFLQIEKRNLNTEEVAQQLMALAGVSRLAIGYSGLKDRNALTSQWFSVQLPGQEGPDWSALNSNSLRVQQQSRHGKKLKIGVHQSNKFSLTIRSISGPLHELEERLEHIQKLGMPNYFGAQRFGRNGANLYSALGLFSGKKRIRGRKMKGLLYSVARSWLFNQLLAKRVETGDWNRCLYGDLMVLAGTNSLFTVEQVDDALRSRTLDMDIHPTGPLFGSGGMSPLGGPLDFENQVLAGHGELVNGLLAAGLKQQRRALRAQVKDLAWQCAEDNRLILNFSLAKGCYATALLDELLLYSEIQDEYFPPE